MDAVFRMFPLRSRTCRGDVAIVSGYLPTRPGVSELHCVLFAFYYSSSLLHIHLVPFLKTKPRVHRKSDVTSGLQ